MSLIQHARPIPEVLKDERVSPRVRKLLAEVDAIKKYGESRGLKPTPNYTEYVQLDRPVAIWVVSAAEQLRFESKTWSFPIVGSFPYLGWYDLQDAKDFAKELKDEDWDVDVRGSRAYSTLGWFRDSILSSMIPTGPGEDEDEALGDLVEVILHESVHATLYIKGQSYFDESIANFLAGELTPQYLTKAHGADSVELKAYEDGEKRSREREKLLHDAYTTLNALYASDEPKEVKLQKKAGVLAKLKEDLHAKRELSNASLIQFKEYHTGNEEFAALYAACGHDPVKFLGAFRSLSELSFAKPQQEDLAPVIRPLVAGGCPQNPG